MLYHFIRDHLLEVPPEVTDNNVINSYSQTGRSDAMQRTPVEWEGTLMKSTLWISACSAKPPPAACALLVLLPGSSVLRVPYVHVPKVEKHWSTLQMGVKSTKLTLWLSNESTSFSQPVDLAKSSTSSHSLLRPLWKHKRVPNFKKIIECHQKDKPIIKPCHITWYFTFKETVPNSWRPRMAPS